MPGHLLYMDLMESGHVCRSDPNGSWGRKGVGGERQIEPCNNHRCCSSCPCQTIASPLRAVGVRACVQRRCAQGSRYEVFFLKIHITSIAFTVMEERLAAELTHQTELIFQSVTFSFLVWPVTTVPIPKHEGCFQHRPRRMFMQGCVTVVWSVKTVWDGTSDYVPVLCHVSGAADGEHCGCVFTHHCHRTTPTGRSSGSALRTGFPGRCTAEMASPPTAFWRDKDQDPLL